MKSKAFTDISTHEGICVSLPYYFSVKEATLEFKVNVLFNYINHVHSSWPEAHATVWSLSEDRGPNWNTEEISLIPNTTNTHTHVQVRC